MAAKKFRGTVNDKIGPELQWSLVDRSSKRVVDDNHCTVPVRCRGQASNVDYLYGRIGWALEIKQLASSRNFPLKTGVVAGVAETYLNSKTRKELDEQFVGAAIRILDRDDAITGREEGEQGVADGSHAGGEAGGRLGRLQIAHLF